MAGRYKGGVGDGEMWVGRREECVRLQHKAISKKPAAMRVSVYDSREKQQIAGNCDDELTTTTVRSSQEILLFGFILLKTIDFYPVRKKNADVPN